MMLFRTPGASLSGLSRLFSLITFRRMATIFHRDGLLVMRGSTDWRDATRLGGWLDKHDSRENAKD